MAGMPCRRPSRSIIDLTDERGLHQIGTDAGGDLVPSRVEMAGHGSVGAKTRVGERLLLQQIELQADAHGAFDGRAADFAVALRCVRIAHRK